MDEGGVISKVPKARWILIGFKDPDILELERSAPTPQSATIALVANAFASLSMEAFQGDVKSAFAQSKPIDRELYVSQPPDGVPGLAPGQLLQWQTEIDGTVRGPAWWRETLVAENKALGNHESSYDPFLHILRGLQEKMLRQQKLQERLKDNPSDPRHG